MSHSWVGVTTQRHVIVSEAAASDLCLHREDAAIIVADCLRYTMYFKQSLQIDVKSACASQRHSKLAASAIRSEVLSPTKCTEYSCNESQSVVSFSSAAANVVRAESRSCRMQESSAVLPSTNEQRPEWQVTWGFFVGTGTETLVRVHTLD